MNKTVYVSLQQARILEGRARDKGVDTLAHGLSARHGHMILCAQTIREAWAYDSLLPFPSPKGDAAVLLLSVGRNRKVVGNGAPGSPQGQAWPGDVPALGP